MKITSLEIENFRGIRQASFTFHRRLNVFIGENGAGKTTILNCLAILLSKLTAPVAAPTSSGRVFSREDISHGADVTRATVCVELLGRSCTWMAGRSTRREKQSLSRLEEVRAASAEINRRLDTDQEANVPLVCLYAPSRSVESVPLRIRRGQPRPDQVEALEKSLSGRREDMDFGQFFSWYRNREDVENERYRLCHENNQCKTPLALDPQLTAVRTALQTLMPGFHRLRVRRRPRLQMVVTKGEEEFRIEELSDGEKCLLAMVADMARRMAMANPSLKNPLEAEAVFLIDEMELHLHPAWQRSIISRLLAVFPKSQFFVTTHSPQILGEVEDTDSIWIMAQGQPHHPARAYGLTSDEILGEIMRTGERAGEVEKELARIAALITDEDFDEVRRTARTLAQRTGVIPALLKVNAVLTMLGEEQADLESENA